MSDSFFLLDLATLTIEAQTTDKQCFVYKIFHANPVHFKDNFKSVDSYLMFSNLYEKDVSVTNAAVT